jgi:hypothetical protein
MNDVNVLIDRGERTSRDITATMDKRLIWTIVETKVTDASMATECGFDLVRSTGVLTVMCAPQLLPRIRFNYRFRFRGFIVRSACVLTVVRTPEGFRQIRFARCFIMRSNAWVGPCSFKREQRSGMKDGFGIHRISVDRIDAESPFGFERRLHGTNCRSFRGIR